MCSFFFIDEDFDGLSENGDEEFRVLGVFWNVFVLKLFDIEWFKLQSKRFWNGVGCSGTEKTLVLCHR